MSVEDQYDKFTDLYVEVNRDALSGRLFDREQVDAFAQATKTTTGIVLDVGCGPGYVTHYLHQSGVDAVGVDLSTNMIAYARKHYPSSSFVRADLGALPYGSGTVGAILSRYSLIHADPASLPEIFDHWAQLLEPGGCVTMGFFAADIPQRHGEPFDHKVVTAYQLFPRLISEQLQAAGFVDITISRRPYVEPERPINHASLAGRRR